MRSSVSERRCCCLVASRPRVWAHRACHDDGLSGRSKTLPAECLQPHERRVVVALEPGADLSPSDITIGLGENGDHLSVVETEGVTQTPAGCRCCPLSCPRFPSSVACSLLGPLIPRSATRSPNPARCARRESGRRRRISSFRRSGHEHSGSSRRCRSQDLSRSPRQDRRPVG